MTAILEKAFKKASELPSPLQEQLATQILQDVAGEAAWDATLASPQSQQMLDKLATAALTASRTGKTHRKGFGEP
jgi:hypothetical protein